MDLAELLTVETSVLRTFCLTVNAESSDLKTRIVENLSEADFYFPITKSIFATVTAMSADGTNVDMNSLQQALTQGSVDVPDDFFLEDLFKGEAPNLATLEAWLRDLEADDRRPASVDSVDGPLETSAISPSLAKTHPSVTPKQSPPARPSEPEPEPEPEKAASPDPPAPEKATVSAPVTKEPPAAAAPAASDVLSPESGAWLGYLAELTKKQGENLKTGFARLDKEWGGLAPGLLLLAGNEQGRLLDFLKQLVDQVAIRCRVPCLYLSFERSKAELRLQTLSRLSGTSAESIQSGRFDKDSKEWQNIIRTGEQAVEWLQRIYVVEPTPGIAVTRIRELRQSLIGSGAGASCLIAIDNLEKLASKTDLLQSVAELKELSESLGIVVVGVASSVELVHEKSADMAAAFAESNGDAVLEVITPGASKPVELRFSYEPEMHRFQEKSAS